MPVRGVWNIFCAVFLLLALANATLWVTAGWRWLTVGVISEHQLSEAVTGGSSDGERGTLLRRRRVVFTPREIVLEVEEVSRLFKTRPVRRLMPPGKRQVEVLSGSDDGPAQMGLLDPATNGPDAANSYVYGNDYPAQIPYWQPLVVFLLPPLTWVTLRVRSHRQAARRAATGLCLVCGYDVRASAERCPECGTEAGARR